ncbi:MAG: glycoside hydrolase family 30 protein [Verrucomicrobiota bacterium]
MKLIHVSSCSALAQTVFAAAILSGSMPPTYGQLWELKKAHIFTTAKSADPSKTGDKLMDDDRYAAFQPLEQPDESYPTIVIDPHKTFQTIEGFGGAFTDSTAVVYAKMPKEAQQKFLKASFDPVEGNGYTLCRTTIHSCDYSDELYTYDSVPGDKELKHFSIEHDKKYRIPLIKAAMESAKGHLRFFASPWSPPGWMKDNDDMLYGGKLKPEYYQTWADYFVKYIKAYGAEGIPMWGLTVQNEAMATQVWESCVFTAEEEKNFVRDYLGPTLEKNGLQNVKIMIWDHNRGIMYQRAEAAYEDPKASKYIWGMAFHWYVGHHYDNARMVHDAYPDKHLLYTEAGIDGSWKSAMDIAMNVIMDLNNWATGFVVWNLLLDQDGYPHHAGGGEPRSKSNIITANTETGEITLNPPHYVFGHFSKFIKPGAKRIACTSSSDDFIATAFVNPDGQIAVVLHSLITHGQIFQIWVQGRALKLGCPPEGIMTVLL